MMSLEEAMKSEKQLVPYYHVPNCLEGYVLNTNELRQQYNFNNEIVELMPFNLEQLKKEGFCYIPGKKLIINLIEPEEKINDLRISFKKP